MSAITLILQNHWLIEENEILSAEIIKLKQEMIHLKSTVQSLTASLFSTAYVYWNLQEGFRINTNLVRVCCKHVVEISCPP